MKTVGIIGASGFIGHRLYRCLLERAGSAFRVSGTALSRSHGSLVHLDVTDADQVEAYLGSGFDFVVFAAGTKDVPKCESDPAFARSLNTTPVELMLRCLERKRLQTRIVYLSSDYVFDGARGSYSDQDPVAPSTQYGRSKALAERLLLDAERGHTVVRSAAVLGKGATFFDWLLRELRSACEARLFSDCFNSPTPMSLLEDLVLEGLQSPDRIAGRVLHLVGDRRLSRFELGCMVARLLGEVPAIIFPVEGAIDGTLFRHDLSLVPSDFVGRKPRASFESYLASEVSRC